MIDPKTKENDAAVITVNENLIGLWFIAHIPGRADFMVGLVKTGETSYEFHSRFKYYKSDAAFDPDDRRSVIVAKTVVPHTREKAIDVCRGLMRDMSEKSEQPYEEILVEDGNLDKFWLDLSRKTWAHLMGVGNV